MEIAWLVVAYMEYWSVFSIFLYVAVDHRNVEELTDTVEAISGKAFYKLPRRLNLVA